MDYVEYAKQDYDNFETICKLPIYVARAWVEPRADSMSFYQRGGYGKETFLMNKGAIKVHTEDHGDVSLWVYKHDYTYYLLRLKGEPKRR